MDSHREAFDPARSGRARPAWLLTLGALVSLGVCAASPAADVRSVGVSRDGADYVVNTELYLDVSHRSVRAVLETYDRIPKLDPDVSEVVLLGLRADGATRMRLTSSHCVTFFCLRYRWTQDVRTLPTGEILALIVPGGGDVDAGWVLYRAEPSGRGTRLVVNARLTAPSLPLSDSIVDAVVRRKLQAEALETATLLERAALGAAAD